MASWSSLTFLISGKRLFRASLAVIDMAGSPSGSVLDIVPLLVGGERLAVHAPQTHQRLELGPPLRSRPKGDSAGDEAQGKLLVAPDHQAVDPPGRVFGVEGDAGGAPRAAL